MRCCRLLLLLLLCLPTGCHRSRQAPPAPPPSPAREPAAGDSEDVPDVQDFGYIQSLIQKNGRWAVTIQYVDILHGEEARKAAVAEKAIGPEDELEDDYYIRETDQTGVFTLEENTPVLLVSDSLKADRPIPLARFAEALRGRDSELSHLSDAPYAFTCRGDRVLKIEQQYVP